MKQEEKAEGTGYDEPNGEDDFLIGEKTEDVKPTGVDDDSTGMEGGDYLGKTNKEKS